MTTDTTQQIAKLNDSLRTTGMGGTCVMTQGVMHMGDDIISKVMQQIISFDNFTADNDPYGEHDFGSVTHQGQTYFWKIDYYDHSYTCHSPDATDASVTNRVMTVMLNSEY